MSGPIEPTNLAGHPTQWADWGTAPLRGSIDSAIVGNFDYAVLQMNRCETRFHRCWCMREVLMLSHQIRQLIAGHQQLDRAALTRRSLDESQLLQTQDHLMDR